MKFQESVSKTREASQSTIQKEKVCEDDPGSDNSMKRKVSVCVSVYRTPDRGKFGKQEKLKESDLQEKHQTGEGRSGEEFDVTEMNELNNKSRKFKAAIIKAIRSENM
eukprot:101575-Karenia_brevis.AAC.1